MIDGESHLYDDQGRFLFLGKRLGLCAACAVKDYTYSVGALGPNTRFCKDCILRNGAKNLRREANQALASAKQKVDELKGAWEDMQRRYKERFGCELQLHRKT